MAQSGLLADLHPPLDADYVRLFQCLADLNLDLQRKGPTARRLLKKSILEAALGSHHASRAAARDCVDRKESSEALYQLGVACLLAACAEAGFLECRGGGPRIGVRSLLEEGRRALVAAYGANPEDEEAARLLPRVAGILAAHPDEEGAAAALRGDEPPKRRRPRRRSI